MGIVYVAIEVGDLDGGDLESIPEAMADPVGERLIPRIYRARPF